MKYFDSKWISWYIENPLKEYKEIFLSAISALKICLTTKVYIKAKNERIYR